jgi:hypothetical protein
MIKYFLIPALLASCLFASSAADAQKAPCGSFQKLPDGRWSVVKLIKIEHEKASAMLNAGTIITPGTQVAGVDIYAALQKSCH